MKIKEILMSEPAQWSILCGSTESWFMASFWHDSQNGFEAVSGAVVLQLLGLKTLYTLKMIENPKDLFLI